MSDNMLVTILEGITKEGERLGLTKEEIIRVKARILARVTIQEEKELMDDIAIRG